MSETAEETRLPSNEEVVDDLLKEFKSTVRTDDTPGEFVINPAPSKDSPPTASGDAPKKPDIPTASEAGRSNPESFVDVDLDKDPDVGEESDSDSIDEVMLKDAEVELTNDQKEERKIIAEELKLAGNDAFKVGDFDRSIEKYTEGLKICPLQYPQQRAVLYCNRSAAKMKLEKYSKAVKDCTKAIELDDKYMKAYIRRAQSYEATEKLDECLADYKKILELDPSHRDAQRAIVRLPPLIEEKNEKLKKEMFGKLKDLGNMILKPFGLSTENFQMEQDPDTKGYKINFKQ